MQNFEVFEQHTAAPFSYFGLTHPFFLVNTTTILFTWIVLAIIIGLIPVCRYALNNKNSVLRFALLMAIKEFKALAIQTLGRFQRAPFMFAASLFIVIFLCNILSLIPWLEEPTADVNTALAFGISSFIYIQAAAIRAHGLRAYISDYFAPFFLLFPLNVIGELASIVSISFRLFGNIFGGAIISRLWMSAISGSVPLELLGIISGINLTLTLFFGLFEGFIQAFVFAMLSLTYLSMALSGDEESEGESA